MCWQTFELLAGFNAHRQTVDILIKIISVHSRRIAETPLKGAARNQKSETVDSEAARERDRIG